MNVILNNYEHLKINNYSAKENIENMNIFVSRNMLIDPSVELECLLDEDSFKFSQTYSDKRNYYQYIINKKDSKSMDEGFKTIVIKLNGQEIASDIEIYFYPINWQVFYPNSASERVK